MRGEEREQKGGEGREEKKRGWKGRGGRRREGRGDLSGNVAEEAFCLKSAPDSWNENSHLCTKFDCNG